MTDTLAPKPSDDAFAATAPLLKADNLCVGFRTDAYLYRTFRAAFGMTPSHYRRSRR